METTLIIAKNCHSILLMDVLCCSNLTTQNLILQFYLTILNVVPLFRLGPGLFLVKEINNGNRNNELMSCPKSVLKLLTLLQNSCKRIIILFLR